jgi:spermidine synthase
VSWLFLLAYTCSGLAGLIYQVCWTRLLTLYIGHTTAAASAVVAAFLGGLAVGAAIAGSYAQRLTPRQAILSYAALEVFVAIAALLLPIEMQAFTPILAWAYADGTSQTLFPAVRLVACLVMVFIPAFALGATFPLAVRWFATDNGNRARSGGALYALNTAGAAAGALLAGFVLIPRIGVTGTTWVGVAVSAVAAACAATAAGRTSTAPEVTRPSRRVTRVSPGTSGPQWLAILVLGLSGFAALLHEIAWTRVLTMVFGPTTYAFAATLAVVIAGMAVGSAVSTALVARTRQPSFWLAAVLAAAAAVSIYTSSLAGGVIPRSVAEQIAQAPDLFNELLWRGALLTAALILPTSAFLGAAFPLALAMVDDRTRSAAGQFGAIYAVNTLGSVVGSLAAGFALIPAFGLEMTLRIVALCVVLGAVLVLSFAALSRSARMRGAIVSAAAMLVMFFSTPWDRELLASGVYLYAQFVPEELPLEPMLKAGTLLYYREGAAATVSVKRLTGTNTLAVDGKTDASNRGDMLTQKLVAHLPLLMHDNPRDVAIVGLGSGVTVAAALTHPIAGVDVLEISPEVVEASYVFIEENRNALADPRTHLLLADGRSHLQLSRQQYDVIISEPSNPWIAGVAALFTREFFLAARDRLAPGGVICQWANAYNISDQDLRSIVATFRSVFPHGTAWLVGGDDVVLIASDEPLDQRLALIERQWNRRGVAEDLQRAGAVEPFTLWSLFVGGPPELERYALSAPVLTDDRMTLEFSAPRELGSRNAGTNGATLRELRAAGAGPEVIRRTHESARAAQWRHRADMMAQRDAFSDAYQDYWRALALDAADEKALAGMVRTAVLTKRGSDALRQLATLPGDVQLTTSLLVAKSRLLASTGAAADALQAVAKALEEQPHAPAALEQLASLQADAADAAALERAVQRMRAAMPTSASTHYYAAVLAFLREDAATALGLSRHAVAADASYAAAYDLMGAAHAKLGEREEARAAFHQSLRFDAHDSTAYANLGVLALEAGERHAATDYFAEALWLDPESAVAREGLRRVTGAY